MLATDASLTGWELRVHPEGEADMEVWARRWIRLRLVRHHTVLSGYL